MSLAALRRPLGSLTDRSLVLPWALAASVAVHGGLLAAHFGGIDGGQPVAAPPTLYASLQPAASTVATDPPPMSVPASPVAAVLPEAPPASSDPAAPPPARAAKVRGSTTPTGSALEIPRVPAQLLTDRGRLGDLTGRLGVEFPIEIDQPVRMPEPIMARYPKAALAQGRGDSVGVWVLVNAEGTAEEVQVLDGSPEFAEEVVAAINAAKFIPAQNRLRNIRFPLALEFQFRAEAATAVAAAAH